MKDLQLELFSFKEGLTLYGYLESDYKGRWTIYKLNTKVDTSLKKVDTSSIHGENKDVSDTERESSTGKVDTSDPKVDTSILISSGRLKKVELEQQIIVACKDNYLKMDEVANRIGTSVDYLKNKIFPSMIKDGKLEKRYPYTHNQPEQGYKTSKDHAKEL